MEKIQKDKSHKIVFIIKLILTIVFTLISLYLMFNAMPWNIPSTVMLIMFEIWWVYEISKLWKELINDLKKK